MRFDSTDNLLNDSKNTQTVGVITPERLQNIARYITIITISGIIAGLFAVTCNLYYVVAVIVGAILMFLVAWQFEAAIAIYVLVAFLPWGRTPDLATGGSGAGKGVFVSEIILGFLLVIWFGRYLLGILPKPRPKSGFYIPMAIYLAYSFLNVIHSILFWDAHVNRGYQRIEVNIIELAIRVLSCSAIVIMATSITNKKWLKLTSIAIMLPGIYNMLNAAFSKPIPIMAPWFPMVVTIPASYFWAITLDKEYNKQQRILAALAVAIAIFTVFFRNIAWVSGWVCLFSALAVVTYIKSRKLFVFVTIIVIISISLGWAFIHKNVFEESEQGGDYDRFLMMKGAVKYATIFPMGVGLGNYRTYNCTYYGNKWNTTTYTSAHGTYSQHLSEMGFPGTFLLLAIIIAGTHWLIVEYKRLASGPSKIFLAVAIGQMIGISVSAIFGDYIFPAYHNGGLGQFSATIYSWLVWGLAVAHVRINGVQTSGSINSDC